MAHTTTPRRYVTFAPYLRAQAHRDDEVGELARILGDIDLSYSPQQISSLAEKRGLRNGLLRARAEWRHQR